MLQSKLQSCKLSQKSWSVELSLLFDLLFSCGLAWIELSLFFVSKIIFTEVGPGYFIILWFCSPKHALLACWVVPCTNLSMPISYRFYFVFFLTWFYFVEIWPGHMHCPILSGSIVLWVLSIQELQDLQLSLRPRLTHAATHELLEMQSLISSVSLVADSPDLRVFRHNVLAFSSADDDPFAPAIWWNFSSQKCKFFLWLFLSPASL